jgi:hypothetical protein
VSAPPQPTAPFPGYQPQTVQTAPLPPQAWTPPPGPVSAPPTTAPPPPGVGAGAKAKPKPVPLIGGLAVAVASILPWFAVEGTQSLSGFDVPLQFLFDPLQPSDGVKIGLIVLLLGLGGAWLSFSSSRTGLRRLLGLAAIAIGGVFILQLASFVDQVGAGVSVTDVIGFGVYVTIVGGVMLLIRAK